MGDDHAAPENRQDHAPGISGDNVRTQDLLTMLRAHFPTLATRGGPEQLRSDWYDPRSGTLALPGTILLGPGTTDADIALFAAVSSITGNLHLQNAPAVSSLVGLHNLRSIDGDLVLEDTGLEYLDGLNNLIRVGGKVRISQNGRLAAVAGLTGLEHVGRGVTIADNTKLTAINGLNSLAAIDGDLEIGNNASLERINGLVSLEALGGTLHLDNCPRLTGIGFLANLKTTANLRLHKVRLDDPSPLRQLFAANEEFKGFIKITGCDLREVSFLTGLRRVGSSLYLHNNRLAHLHGLEKLEEVGASLSLSDNRLTDISHLANLRRIHGLLGLADNNLVSLRGLENLQSVRVVKWSGAFRSIMLQGNPALRDIHALENIKPAAGHVIIAVDDHAYPERPHAGSPFCRNSLEVIEASSRQNLPRSHVCGGTDARGPHAAPAGIKILFANSWHDALKKCPWLNPYYHNFTSAREVIAFCRENGIETLIANIYRTQVFLAKNELELKQHGLKFLANKVRVSNCMIDKKKFTDFICGEDLSLYIPRMYGTGEDLRYPCIVKPRMGGAGRGVRLVTSPEMLGETGTESEIFEYTPGNVEFASSILYRDGVIRKAITYSKTFAKSLYVFQQEAPAGVAVARCEPRFLDIFKQILDLLHPEGGDCTCSINYKLAGDIPKIFEINPRLGYTLAKHSADFKEMIDIYIAETRSR